MPGNVCLSCRDFTCEYEVVLCRKSRSKAAFFVGGGINRTIDLAAPSGVGIEDGEVEGRGER